MKLMDFVNEEYFESDDKFNECVKILEKMRNDNLEKTDYFCYGTDCEDCVFSSWCSNRNKKSPLKHNTIVIDDKKFKIGKEFYDYVIPSLKLEYQNYKASKVQPSTLEVNGDKTQGVVQNEHYKYKIQPIDYIIANNFDFVRGNIIKYASRVGRKKGEEANDIIKIIDYTLFLAKQNKIDIDLDKIKKLIDFRKEN